MIKLKYIDCLIELNEAKTKVLNEFEKKFGKDFVYSRNMDFCFDSKSFSIVYKILNAYLFDNKLKLNKLDLYICSRDDFQIMVNRLNCKNKDTSCLYAAYLPEIHGKTGKLIKESIFIMNDKKMTFLFAVSCLCHEMIHQFDTNYGILIQLMKEDEERGIDRSHETPIFVRYMRLASMEGIRVMINGNNTPFDILNQEAIQFTMNLQEDDNTHFFELVKRLKAGEKIPNVCLTNRDTVMFLIP